MINEALKLKEEAAIAMIRKAEGLATLLNPEKGMEVAFSGGKDSVVLLDLAKRAQVKFFARMKVTGCDPPELMKYVRREYPEVILDRPRTNMYALIMKNGILPTRVARFCCKELKERRAEGGLVLLGIRGAESVKRSKRSAVEVQGKKGVVYSLDGSEVGAEGGGGLFDDIEKKEAVVCHAEQGGGEEVLVSPIFEWEEADVWNYIRGYRLPYCKLYDEGAKRLGCVLCPMARVGVKRADAQKYPLFAERVYLRAIRDLRAQGKYTDFESAEEVFDWWLSDLSKAEWLANRGQGVLL